MAVDIGFVVFDKIMAVKKEGCDLFSILPEPDRGKIPAHA